MRFMQTESVLQTKNRSGPAKNRFSVALVFTMSSCRFAVCRLITMTPYLVMVPSHHQMVKSTSHLAIFDNCSIYLLYLFDKGGGNKKSLRSFDMKKFVIFNFIDL